MIELAFPYSTGEWLAWLVALGCVIAGVVMMFMPRFFMKQSGLLAAQDNLTGVSEIRGPVGGFYLGIGVAAIMFAQPLVYAAIGFAFAGAVIGRMISFLFDRSMSRQTLLWTVVEGFGAFFPIAYVFGLIA